MAHTCPECWQYCTCHGDIDDIDFGEWDGCSCDCQKYPEMSDLIDDDDDDDAEQSIHPTLLESAPLQALSKPENSATSQTNQTPQQRG